MTPRIAVLLSTGRNPRSQRVRRADRDARALEMALAVAAGGAIDPVHAGAADRTALGTYLGMGIHHISVLEQPVGCDALDALVSYLRRTAPDLILMGERAEDGLGSGHLPYALAAALGSALIPEAAALTLADGRVEVVQALGKGRRRRLSAPWPCVVTVGTAAPVARQSAFAQERAGRLDVVAQVAPAGAPVALDTVLARAKPKRVAQAVAGSATDRLRALTQMSGGHGSNLVNPDADEAAKAILGYLEAEGIVDLPEAATTPGPTPG